MAYKTQIIHFYKDPETGCTSQDQTAFESCKQAFYLKQQNQILQNQQQKQNTQSVVQPMASEPVATSVQTQMEINRDGNWFEFLLILIMIVIATVFITKNWGKT